MPRTNSEDFQYQVYMEEEKNHQIEWYEEVELSMKRSRSTPQSEKMYPDSYAYRELSKEYRTEVRDSFTENSLNSSKDSSTMDRRSSQ